MIRQCEGQTRTGARCTAVADASGYCRWHRGALAQEADICRSPSRARNHPFSPEDVGKIAALAAYLVDHTREQFARDLGISRRSLGRILASPEGRAAREAAESVGSLRVGVAVIVAGKSWRLPQRLWVR